MLKVAINFETKLYTVYDEIKLIKSSEIPFNRLYRSIDFYKNSLYKKPIGEVYNAEDILELKIDDRVSSIYIFTFFLQYYFTNKSFPYKDFHFVWGTSYDKVFIDIAGITFYKIDPNGDNKYFIMRYIEKEKEVIII